MAIVDIEGTVFNWNNFVYLYINTEEDGAQTLRGIATNGGYAKIATVNPKKTLSGIYNAIDAGYTAYQVEE